LASEFIGSGNVDLMDLSSKGKSSEPYTRAIVLATDVMATPAKPVDRAMSQIMTTMIRT
jgi:hypothetical protein